MQLALARINVARHGLEKRIRVVESDLFSALPGRYDLIVCNPPYVPEASMRALPAEYRAEPALALAGGEDGMDLIRRIVAEAPEHLSDIGVLVIEVGHERPAFEAAFPRVECAWLETRIRVIESDLFSALPERYDLILCNPPYVPEDSMRALPAEYRAEPALALAGGRDGMDLIRRIVAEASDHLSDFGVLVLEVGHERAAFEAAFPRLECAWLETSAGEDAVVLIERQALPLPSP